VRRVSWGLGEVTERHEARECVLCGSKAHGAAQCTVGYRGILGISAAEVQPPQQAAPEPEPEPAKPTVQVNVPRGPAPIVQVAAAPRPLAERADEELRRANWCGPEPPRVSRDVLEARLSGTAHARLSREKGGAWAPLTSVAKALGAVHKPTQEPARRKRALPQAPGGPQPVQPAARSAKEIEAAKARREQEAARAWVATWWPAHADAAVQAARVDATAAAGEQHVAGSGHKTSQCVALSTVFAVYSA